MHAGLVASQVQVDFSLGLVLKIVSDIAIFVLKRDIIPQLTN